MVKRSTAAKDAAPAGGAKLERYRAMRDFGVTAEPAPPAGARPRGAKARPLGFVIQKHWASRLHYDFRLELDGVLVSWAVPKGPSYDPAAKPLAIHVEDHPLDYARFEGTIPKGQYGAGTVIVWDEGTWDPVGDPRAGLAAGKLLFTLHGQKLAGRWELVRISKPGDRKQEQWILFKKRGDAWARPVDEFDVVTAWPDSVVHKPLGLVEQREPRGGGSVGPVEVDLSAAVAAALPATLEPQLATLTAAAPRTGRWIVENKFDGYRILARIEDGEVRLFTRNGHDWTDRLQGVADDVARLGIGSAFLDGEIVVIGERGMPDFNRLQNAVDDHAAAIDYVVFDLPFLDGRDLRRVPLESRRAVLAPLLARGRAQRVRFSDSFDAAPQQVLDAACRMGLEGVMVKRADSPYASRRNGSWLKLKCSLRQEFVVVGFTDRGNASDEVGSLLLALPDVAGGPLRFAGGLGTGWSSAEARALHARLVPLETGRPAVDPGSAAPGRWSKRGFGRERWVKPKLVVEVAFSGWTADGQVRHARWQGLRADKRAGEVVRERAVAIDERAPSSRSAPPGAPALRITSADRVIDSSTGFTKGQLVRYYASVAPFILPHLRDRPVALVRAPEGVAGATFFQKHVEETKLPGITELDPALWPGHPGLLVIDSEAALVAAAQMNTVEFHTWNSTSRHLDLPDRVIFDLDPGAGVSWQQLQEAALLMHALLDELGLASWLKTSGGKGLHLVVPLAPKLDYDRVKAWSQAVVVHVAKTIPKRFVAKSGGSNRIGRIFVDYLRNGQGQTTACAFSARARPGLGVSMPISWDQLPTLKSASQWSIATAREYLSLQHDDPWAAFWKSRQTLTKSLAAFDAG